MDNNKHRHYDLIVEWAKDTSKKWQYLYGDSWHDCGEGGPVWDTEGKYREKPHEFIKGHWYPCFFSGSAFAVMVYSGEWFYSKSSLDSVTYAESEFLKVGESLGEIKFNE